MLRCILGLLLPLSHDSVLMSLLIELGSSRRMDGGWFDELLMYRGSSFGFLYGL